MLYLGSWNQEPYKLIEYSVDESRNSYPSLDSSRQFYILSCPMGGAGLGFRLSKRCLGLESVQNMY